MQALSRLDPAQLYLLVAPRRMGNRLVSVLTARMALSGPVRVLDGGNCFDVYTIARAVRQWTPYLEPVLEQISIARAFTCHQVVALLAAQKPDGTPILALDPLATFADENVPAGERGRLLRQSILHLERLASQAHVLVSAASPASPLASDYLEQLSRAASQTWRLEEPAEQTASQAALPGFGEPRRTGGALRV